MAIPEVDGVTIGLYPLPATAPRASNIAGVPAGQYEFKPAVDLIPDAEPTYVKPYQPFTFTVSAFPNLPNETIVSMRVTGPSSCILEEPLPTFDTTRSFDTDFEIPVSTLWVAPQFSEPFLFNTEFASGAAPIVTISGYYSEKNFYDREWLLRFPDSIAKISGGGIKYELLSVLETMEETFDPSMLVKTYPSSINEQTFYPLTPADAKLYDTTVMETWLKRCSDIISYKPSDIKKLRMFFDIEIISNQGTFKYSAHMTVQNDQENAIKRLEYGINTPKVPKPLLLNGSV